jgi:hypothetical protein
MGDRLVESIACQLAADEWPSRLQSLHLLVLADFAKHTTSLPDDALPWTNDEASLQSYRTACGIIPLFVMQVQDVYATGVFDAARSTQRSSLRSPEDLHFLQGKSLNDRDLRNHYVLYIPLIVITQQLIYKLCSNFIHDSCCDYTLASTTQAN